MYLKFPKLLAAVALAWFAYMPGTRADTTATLTTLHSFSALSGVKNVEGSDPNAALILGSDGNFYGTALYGFNGVGGIFKMTPDGTVTPVYGFDFNVLNALPSPNGAHPTGSLVEGPDGNFYGTTSQNGMRGAGTVFQVTPAGVLTNLYNFGGTDSDGGTPAAGLILGNDGNFYGTTPAFNSGFGTIFKITPTGAFTTLHSFASSEPYSPKGQLCLGTDGNFYGVGSAGGNGGNGGVFKMTPDGTFTTLYLFKGADDGSSPVAGLIQGTDGNFYGTTTYGNGPTLEGTIFRITPAGALTTLHDFNADYDPNFGGPGDAFGRLLQGSDGNFYGTTFTAATIFQMTPAGDVTILYHFPDSNPRAGLIQTSDGSFYGTSTDDLNYPDPPDGTVFKLSVSGVGAALPVVTLSAPVPTVSAGSGQAGEFLFTISSAPTSGKVKVFYQIKGNATNGTDYETIAGVVKFKPGKPTSKMVPIVPLGDGQGGETRKVKLVLEPGTGYAVGTTGKITVKIVPPSN